MEIDMISNRQGVPRDNLVFVTPKKALISMTIELHRLSALADSYLNTRKEKT
jgi:hypothetical protein